MPQCGSKKLLPFNNMFVFYLLIEEIEIILLNKLEDRVE